jgi:hypothetical protein
MIYNNLIRTSQETRYISVAQSKPLILFREAAAYGMKHTKQMNTLCWHNAQILDIK